MITWMEANAVTIGLGALAITLVLLTVFLIAYCRTAKATKIRFSMLEGMLVGRLNQINEETGRSNARSRDAIGENVSQLAQSVSHVIQEMNRAQRTEYEEWSKKLIAQSEASVLEKRQVHQRMEERMAAFETRVDRLSDAIDHRLEKNDIRIDRMNSMLTEKMANNDVQIERLRGVVETRLEAIQRDNANRIADLQRTFGERLTDTLETRLGDRFRNVTDRLDQVYNGLGEMQTIANGMGDLRKVLTNANVRGILGEVQLGALLSQMMSPDQYERDYTLTVGGESVSYAIRLPGREGKNADHYLPVDARFPVELYANMTDATNEGDTVRADLLRDEMERTLESMASALFERCIQPPKTTEFAVIFLPTEGLYAEALRRGGLVDRLKKDYNTSIAGPATMAALINNLQMGIRTLALEKRGNEVWEALKHVREDFVEFAAALSQTQDKLREASETIDAAAKRTGDIKRRLSGMEIPDSGPAIDAIHAIESSTPEDKSPLASASEKKKSRARPSKAKIQAAEQAQAVAEQAQAAAEQAQAATQPT